MLIEEIVEGTKYDYPPDYLDTFNEARKNFLLFYDNIKEEDIIFHKS